MAFRYPVRDASEWRAIQSPPVSRRVKAHLRHVRASMPLPRTSHQGLLEPVGHVAPLAPDDIPAICIVRNANNYIRSFLRYYRALGVTRFIVVDDRSVDGTRAALEDADD